MYGRESERGGGGLLIWDLDVHEQAWYKHPSVLSATQPPLLPHVRLLWQVLADWSSHLLLSSLHTHLLSPPLYPKKSAAVWWLSSKAHSLILKLTELSLAVTQTRPGQPRSGCQVCESYKVPAILSEAKCNSCVACAWRLHLTMHGVVTPDHS